MTAVVALAACATLEGQALDIGTRLMGDPAVQKALEAARADDPRTIEDQVRICEVPAPPFMESARAEAYAQAFRGVGLRNVRIDKAGNVLGERPGRSPRPHVVI